MIGLAGMSLASVPAARAQFRDARPVVAIVAFAPLSEIVGSKPINLPIRAFVEGLHELGWIEGKTITLVQRSAEGVPDRMPAIMRGLIADGVDVIFLGGSSRLHFEAQAATTTIPLVAMFADDPVATRFAASLARPGGNLTGVTRHAGPELYGKWFQLLREIAPAIERTAFLAPRATLEDLKRADLPTGVAVVPVAVEVGPEIEEAFARIVREKADSLMVTTGPLFHFNAHRIAAFCLNQRLPSMSAIREIAVAGGLLSYGPSVASQFRQAARHVDRILKGANPAELPIEQPTTLELVINLNTAKALGLTVPPTLLIRADDVVE